MKTNLLLLFLLFMVSCSNDDENLCENCESIIGKRWYQPKEVREHIFACGGGWNEDISDKISFEDFILNEDGTIDVWRYEGESYENATITFIENIRTYKIQDDCTLLLNGDIDTLDLPDILCTSIVTIISDYNRPSSNDKFKILDTSCDSTTLRVLLTPALIPFVTEEP